MKIFSSNRNHSTWLFMGFLVLFAGSVAFSFAYIGMVTHQIDQRIEQLRSARATEFFGKVPTLQPQQVWTRGQLDAFFEEQGYVERSRPENLSPREFSIQRTPTGLTLTLLRPEFNRPGHSLFRMKSRLEFRTIEGGKLELTQVADAESTAPVDKLVLAPKKIAAYYAGRFRSQNAVPISEMPVSVRHAVMAIEDVHFLEHVGVSFRGTLRALLRDVQTRRFAEGGSTLTQQLMKNLFFSHEKAVSRKLKEALFAFVTEMRHSKEAILEAYLNEVYLGQSGPHEIHGVSEGARYYFNRPVSQLSLAQAATLAAIVQAPNSQDPYKYPDRTLRRRNLVLKKMRDAELILDEEYKLAIAEPIGVSQAGRLLADIDYALDLVFAALPPSVQHRMEKENLAIFTTIDPTLQNAGSQVMRTNLDRIKAASRDVVRKEAKGVFLQGSLLAIDLDSCGFLSVQGGRNYQQTQFNRALSAKRQPGSLIKPFVFLSAFESPPDVWGGQPFSAVTPVEDSPLEWTTPGQPPWTPKNYEGDFRGVIRARDVLEHSINVPTARITQKIGVPALVKTLRQAGIESPLPEVPSLSLGSAALTPIEMATAYASLARLGKRCKLRVIDDVYDSSGNLIYQEPLTETEAFSRRAAFETVHLMKGVLTYGTGRAVSASGLRYSNLAGKTGTTNDAKDAWFAGFSPKLLVIVWVGYDEEANRLGLTGAAAALPAWIDFVKHASEYQTSIDFAAPEDLHTVWVDRDPPVPGKPGCRTPQLEYLPAGVDIANACDQKSETPAPKPDK